MQIDAAGGLEDTVQLDHALRHHVVLAEEGAQRGQQLTYLARLFSDDFLVGEFGFQAPAPGVVEGGDLRGRLFTAALAKEDIVGRIGVEGWVQVDEVNALVDNMLTQDDEVVAEVELVGGSITGGHFLNDSFNHLVEYFRGRHLGPAVPRRSLETDGGCAMVC